MTIKHYLAILFMMASFSLFGQSPGYFGKTIFVGIGSDIELISLIDPNSTNKYAPTINLEIGKLVSPKTGIVMDVKYSTANAVEEMYFFRSSYSDEYDVDYTRNEMSVALVGQFYSRLGPFAPIGIYSKTGVRVVKTNFKINSYSNSRYGSNPGGEASSDDFNMPNAGTSFAFRYGLGFNQLLNRSAMIGLESIIDFHMSANRESSTQYEAFFKVSYIHFIF